MTRAQAMLVLVLATLTVVLFGRIAWALLSPVATSVPGLVVAVPAWAWWTAFGVGMGLVKLVAFHRLGWSCGSCAS